MANDANSSRRRRKSVASGNRKKVSPNDEAGNEWYRRRSQKVISSGKKRVRNEGREERVLVNPNAAAADLIAKERQETVDDACFMNRKWEDSHMPALASYTRQSFGQRERGIFRMQIFVGETIS